MGSGNTGVGLAEATLTEAHCPSMPTTDAAPKASEAQQMKSPPGSTFKPGWQVNLFLAQKRDFRVLLTPEFKISANI